MIICDEELVNKSLDFATKNDVKVIACDDSYPKDSENIIYLTIEACRKTRYKKLKNML